ncbi:hypothetical protein QYE76_006375 [Lolium multiflorum]|uniref:Uncharacterized protein n=1 Tax=Lolium multiflorum TaxID=4521 RepID=A0AAD8RUS0_LOLMU|nr:hypothetical protein QYE76_006375 [Lolium multiflorum]
MSAVTVNAQPSLIASKPAMVWKPELSEFVLNRLVQLVRSGVCFNMGFKEQQMKKSEDGCCFYGGDEGAADEYILRYLKHRQYVDTPITNYAQMKTIFTPRFICKAQLF